MTAVRIELGERAYDVTIEAGLLDEVGERVRAVAPHDRALMAVDANVAATHGAVATDSMRRAGYRVETSRVTAEETAKRLGAVERLLDAMAAARLDRAAPIVSVGGGITGDVAGFAAAIWLRGVPVVHVPTTLLAAVDASVGGKTGVNHPVPSGLGKNAIGAFWQPRAVLFDPRTLRTLDPREVRCGLAECIKHAILADCAHLDWIETHLDRLLALDEEAILALVRRSVEIKAAIVAADEREAGGRAVLNLGHTFAHAIESAPELDLRHGEAVAIGLVASSSCAAATGRLDGADAARVRSIIERAGLPAALPRPLPLERAVGAMHHDKKVLAGRVRLVLPHGLGRAKLVEDVPQGVIEAAWREVGAG